MGMSLAHLARCRLRNYPENLFRGGAVGVWFDPSDFSTMYQDASGTQPVTALGQPVGLMLDMSQGLQLGSDLVTNGNGSNTSGWIGLTGAGSSFQTSSGEFVLTNASTVSVATNRLVYQTRSNFVVGRTYKVTATLRAGTCATAGVGISTTTTGGINDVLFLTTTSKTNVSVSGYFVATATELHVRLYNDTTGGGTCYYDNITVREVAGNHASQTTTTKRPALEARVNMLEKTEDASNVYWTKTRLSSPTATRLTEDASAATTHYLRRVVTVVSGQEYMQTVEAKAGERTWIQIGANAGVNNNQGAYFNLANGTVGNVTAGATATISSVGDGWYRCTFKRAITSTTYNCDVALASANGAITYDGDGVSGVSVRKMSLAPTTISGYAVPDVYQYVNTATDYTDIGSPRYLSFDGTDDFMQTQSIYFTGTDSMSVLAGIRKLSDTAYGMVVELSTSFVTNTGSFRLAAPVGESASISYGSNGTSIATAEVATGYPAPRSSVLAGISDISSDVAILRENGVQLSSVATNQGTGNYGNYVMYIGARAGTSSFFNGRLYGLIVCGADKSADISRYEQWMNSRMGRIY